MEYLTFIYANIGYKSFWNFGYKQAEDIFF